MVDHCASVAHKKVSCQGFICVDLSPSACALVCFLIVLSFEGGVERLEEGEGTSEGFGIIFD